MKESPPSVCFSQVQRPADEASASSECRQPIREGASGPQPGRVGAWETPATPAGRKPLGPAPLHLTVMKQSELTLIFDPR